eukprot:936325-Rhodomonas_salina.1
MDVLLQGLRVNQQVIDETDHELPVGEQDVRDLSAESARRVRQPERYNAPLEQAPLRDKRCFLTIPLLDRNVPVPPQEIYLRKPLATSELVEQVFMML